MSTLLEIEEAIEKLPAPQLEELLRYLSGKVGRGTAADPFEAVVGAFTGPQEATGRNAEEILYGRGAGA
jgi:hypothetical protein